MIGGKKPAPPFFNPSGISVQVRLVKWKNGVGEIDHEHKLVPVFVVDS